MGTDLSRFNVVYNEKVLRALSLNLMDFKEGVNWEDVLKKPKVIEILAINEDGNIIVIRDEAWKFQFIPVLNQG